MLRFLHTTYVLLYLRPHTGACYGLSWKTQEDQMHVTSSTRHLSEPNLYCLIPAHGRQPKISSTFCVLQITPVLDFPGKIASICRN